MAIENPAEPSNFVSHTHFLSARPSNSQPHKAHSDIGAELPMVGTGQFRAKSAPLIRIHLHSQE